MRPPHDPLKAWPGSVGGRLSSEAQKERRPAARSLNLERRAFLAGALGALAAPALAQQRLPAPEATQITRWRGDPYALGSYSFLAKGATPSHRAALATPLGPLFFAGEATHPDHPATVHGALLSGQRAAAEIIAAGRSLRIAIIGAGFAGLGAAKALEAAGALPEIIEARDRIGGRVHSADLGNAKIDLGASWIHGIEDNPLTDLADITGAQTRVTEWDRVAAFSANGRKRLLPFLPRAARDVEMSLSYGADVGDLSPDAFYEGEEFGGDEVTFPRGYATLLPALLGDYPIALNRPVMRIDWTRGGGVTLSLRGTRRAYDA
ncbi:MAG: FAD-dependent oxidoreductase, partial [Pseudomonadota bacterium]